MRRNVTHSAQSRRTPARVALLPSSVSAITPKGGNMGTALALADPSYSAPALAYTGELAESEDVVWWIVVVGFAYAVALAYVAWCRHNGGDGEISSVGRGSRLSVTAASSLTGGRAAACRPPAGQPAPLLVAGRRQALRRAYRPRRRRPRRAGRCRGRPRRPERLRQDHAAPRCCRPALRRCGSHCRRRYPGRVAHRACFFGAHSGRADGLRSSSA